MTSLEIRNADGQLDPINYSGQIIFTDDGNVSVQAMHPDPEAADTIYTSGGYEAFYGTFSIDEETRTFVVTVSSSAARDMIGRDFERSFVVTNDELVIMPTNTTENWCVTYKRV